MRVGMKNYYPEDVIALLSLEKSSTEPYQKAYSNFGETGRDIERVGNALTRVERVRRVRAKKRSKRVH